MHSETTESCLVTDLFEQILDENVHLGTRISEPEPILISPNCVWNPDLGQFTEAFCCEGSLLQKVVTNRPGKREPEYLGNGCGSGLFWEPEWRHTDLMKARKVRLRTDTLSLRRRSKHIAETCDESKFVNKHLSDPKMLPNRLSEEQVWLILMSPFWNEDKEQTGSDEKDLSLVSTPLIFSAPEKFDCRSLSLDGSPWPLLWLVFEVRKLLSPSKSPSW